MECATLMTVPAEMSRAANTPRPFPGLSRTVTRSALAMSPPSLTTPTREDRERWPTRVGQVGASLDESVEFLEFPGAGAFEPLEHDHFAVDDIDAFLGQPGEGALEILLCARADRVGDHERLEALSLEVDRGLHHA